MTDGNEAAPAAVSDGPSSRRSALAALAAGAALGLGSLGGVTRQAEAAKDRKRTQKARGENNGQNDKNNGRNGNDNRDKKLPAIQYVVSENEIDANGDFTGFADCPDDYLPINGGIEADASAFNVVSSTPNADERRWEVEISDAVVDGTLSVFAVCLEARDETPRDAQRQQSDRRNRRGGKKGNSKGKGKGKGRRKNR